MRAQTSVAEVPEMWVSRPPADLVKVPTERSSDSAPSCRAIAPPAPTAQNASFRGRQPAMLGMDGGAGCAALPSSRDSPPEPTAQSPSSSSTRFV